MQALTIACADGHPLAASVFAGGERGAVVLAPALGVPRRVYEGLAGYLREQGYSALCFDYRGFGGSMRGPAEDGEILMQHWGERDIEAVLRWAKSELRPRKLFLIGHSAGGQLPGLAPASETLDGLVLVASTAPHPSLYPMPEKLAFWTLWSLLVPLFSRGRRYFPARRFKLGSGDIAAAAVRQWAAWARTPGYMFNPVHGIDTARYSRLRLPLLSWGFSDDSYASPQAIAALLARYSAAQVDNRRVTVSRESPVGHFGFFRDRQRDTLWKETVDWLSAH